MNGGGCLLAALVVMLAAGYVVTLAWQQLLPVFHVWGWT
jgi:hypothetical protein